VSSITDKDGASIVPGLEQLVLEVHARDCVFGSLIDQISHCSKGGLEIPDLIDHVTTLLRSPLAVAELFVLALSHCRKLANNGIANTVAWYVEEDPL